MAINATRNEDGTVNIKGTVSVPLDETINLQQLINERETLKEQLERLAIIKAQSERRLSEIRSKLTACKDAGIPQVEGQDEFIAEAQVDK